jgi:hypothetical protein
MATLFLFLILIIILFLILVVFLGAAGDGIKREARDIRSNPILYVLSAAVIILLFFCTHR